MPLITLKTVANTNQSDSSNRIVPLSYTEWTTQNGIILQDNSESKYNNYLSTFFADKTQKAAKENQQLRDDYINLLKRLQIIFKDDEEFDRISQIDFDNETELKIAISFEVPRLN